MGNLEKETSGRKEGKKEISRQSHGGKSNSWGGFIGEKRKSDMEGLVWEDSREWIRWVDGNISRLYKFKRSKSEIKKCHNNSSTKAHLLLKLKCTYKANYYTHNQKEKRGTGGGGGGGGILWKALKRKT